ncbi:hypothetical protein J3459_017449, partial [Metarhizium acridum]
MNLKHPMENYVKSTCEHFVRVIRSRVHLIHQTAREFLLQQQESKEETLSVFHHMLIPEECESTLLRSCISYLFLVAVAPDKDSDTEKFIP